MSLMALHDSNREMRAEIERLKAELANKDAALEFANGARQEWFKMYMQKREAIAAFRAGLIRAGAKTPIDHETMSATEQGLTIALVGLDSELKRVLTLKFDLASVAERGGQS